MRSTGSPITGTALLARFTAPLTAIHRLPFIFNQLLVRLNFSVTRYLDIIKLSSRMLCSFEKQKLQKFGTDFIVGFLLLICAVSSDWHFLAWNKTQGNFCQCAKLHVDSVIYNVYCQSVWHWLLMLCRTKPLQSKCVCVSLWAQLHTVWEVLVWDQRQNSGIQEEESLMCLFHLTML